MKKIKRNSVLTIIAVIISIISLSMSLAALYRLNNDEGVANVIKWEWKLELSSISDIDYSANTALFQVEPKIEDNVLVYGITLGNDDAFGQFNLQIDNLGNVDAKLEEIKVEGIDESVEVNITGIEVGDVIKSSKSDVVKVITKLKSSFKGGTIKLDNVRIMFVFTEDK